MLLDAGAEEGAAAAEGATDGEEDKGSLYEEEISLIFIYNAAIFYINVIKCT